MRAIVIGLAAASFVSSVALASGSAQASPFEIRGTWAADGQACGEAATFVEFDGQDMLGFETGSARVRVAADYVVASEDGRVTVSLTDLSSQDRDQLVFQVGDTDALQLDSAFGPVKLIRCPGHPRQLASKP